MLLDRKLSIGFFIFTVLIFLESFKYPPQTMVFPRFLLAIFLVLTVILMIKPNRNNKFNPKVELSRVKILTMLSIISYAILIPIIGFFVTTLIYIVLFCMCFQFKKCFHYFIIASLYLSIVYLVFQKWLSITFPSGALK